MNKVPIVFHPNYDVTVVGGSRFPVQKYQYLKKLLEKEGILTISNLFVPSSLTMTDIYITHHQPYVDRVKNLSLLEKEKRQIGLPSIDLFCERAFFSAGGTYLAAKLALKFGFAANGAGGSHHAARFGGSGFCIFNDVAIAVNCLLKYRAVRNVIILDLDVHQGDGTAEIFKSDDRVFTVSIHCKKNFPLKKACSDLDLGMDAGVTDRDYLSTLERVLDQISQVPADLIVYNAGVDVHENDSLGHLKLSSFGIELRENKVVDFAVNRRVPLLVTLGGGYQKNVANLALLHSMIFKAVAIRLK